MGLRKKNFLGFLVLSFALAQLNSLNALSYPIHAFYSYQKVHMQKMELIGQVSAFSKILSSKRERLLFYDTREMVITARLYETEGIRLGDKVYVIKKDPDHRKYKNGYIIGEGLVFSIFKTEFQGWMLKASGNFSMVSKGHFIAIPKIGSSRREAWVHYKQGDKYLALGKLSKAFALYKKSLMEDPQRPETYFRLALIGKKIGLQEESYQYLSSAWKRLNKFADVNDVLKLPGIYLEWENQRIEKISMASTKLRALLGLLTEIRKYQKQLTWFKHAIAPSILKMLESKGLPDVGFQLEMGKLYQAIHDVLESKPVTTVLYWLSKKERHYLYEPLHLPYRSEPYSHPKRSWDLAFFDAALYHYQLAHELNPLDVRAAFQIIRFCFDQAKKDIPKPKRDSFRALIKHFAAEYLKIPSANNKMTYVRNVLKKLSQL